MNPIHQRITDARARRLQHWKDKVANAVRKRLRDARLYAELKRADTATALDRLDELGEALSQILSDARAGFYQQAFDLHRLDWDPEVHRDVYPDPDGEDAARHKMIGNLDQHRDIHRLIEEAKQGLRTRVSAALPLGTWEGQHRDAIGARIKRHLNDAQVALHEAVGQVLIQPHLR